MSKFSVGDEVCQIPNSQASHFLREKYEGKKLVIHSMDETGCYLMRAGDSRLLGYRYFDKLILWSEATPAQRAGLCVGDKVRVDENDAGSIFTFPIGSVLTFIEDDESYCPRFEFNGDTNYFKSIEEGHGETVIKFTRLLSDTEEETRVAGDDIEYDLQNLSFYHISDSGHICKSECSIIEVHHDHDWEKDYNPDLTTKTYTEQPYKSVGGYIGEDSPEPLSAMEKQYQEKQDAILAESARLVGENKKHRIEQSRIISGLVELPDIPRNGRF